MESNAIGGSGKILLEMIKNGFISLDGKSKKQRAAKLIALKKWLSSSDLSDTEREREGEDLIVYEEMFPCVMNYCLTLSHI